MLWLRKREWRDMSLLGGHFRRSNNPQSRARTQGAEGLPARLLGNAGEKSPRWTPSGQEPPVS